jgi:carbon-monoxide dehydrogenase large subunit
MMGFVGSRVARVEDQRLVTGAGHFIDDLQLPRMVHAAFVRSPVAHARIVRVDVDAARRGVGVVAVLTGEDMLKLTGPMAAKAASAIGVAVPEVHVLATDKVRSVGDLVAMVIAEDRYAAEDAAERVEVDYDILEPVVTWQDALDPTLPPLYDDLDTNVLYERSQTYGDVGVALAAADRVLEVRLCQHRVANCPMETRGAVADFDEGSGELTYHTSTQGPHMLRLLLADALGHPAARLRVVTRDVGGAFGLKAGVYREDLCVAAASRELRRPVKWIEDRNEHLLASGHAREETADVRVAVRADGTVLGLEVDLVMDQGAHLVGSGPAASFSSRIEQLLPGPYRVPAYSFRVAVVATNKCGYVAYRGPWAMETWVRERVLDLVAQELDLDPAEVRRRNMVSGAPGERTITGLSLAGVSSRRSLERALEVAGYEDLRREQDAARAAGRATGIGFATYIEPAPGPPEMWAGGGPMGREPARVRLEPDGRLVVVTAQAPHGQGHETTLAQVAADEMGVAFDQVRVVYGDTQVAPFSVIGTGGSRAATWASGAVIRATRRLKEKVFAISSELMEVAPEDLEISDGVVAVRGAPRTALPLAQVATLAYMAPGRLPPDLDCDLQATDTFLGEGIEGSGWSGGTHLCTVEIDLATGHVTIGRYLVVEDCGRMINPAIVDGQIRGGVAQGIGAVLHERVAYDEDGNCLTGTLMDYMLPTATDVPEITIEHLDTDPHGEFGFRGVGEGGAIVSPAALTNAIADALAQFGSRVTEQHLPPAHVLELIDTASRTSTNGEMMPDDGHPPDGLSRGPSARRAGSVDG